MTSNVLALLPICLVFTVLLLITACGQDKTELKDTVLKYDALLAEGYRSLNMNPLAQAATEERATKAYHHMAALGEGGVKMDSKLRDIQFIKIKQVENQKAEVTTEEKWDYTYIDISSGKQAFDNSGTYRLKYALEKKSGKWLVADITVEKSEEKKNIVPDFFHRSPKENPPGGKAKEPNKK